MAAGCRMGPCLKLSIRQAGRSGVEETAGSLQLRTARFERVVQTRRPTCRLLNADLCNDGPFMPTQLCSPHGVVRLATGGSEGSHLLGAGQITHCPHVVSLERPFRAEPLILNELRCAAIAKAVGQSVVGLDPVLEDPL